MNLLISTYRQDNKERELNKTKKVNSVINNDKNNLSDLSTF